MLDSKAEGRAIAGRLRAARLARNWSRETLTEIADVSLGSLIRFETTGQISLDRLLRLADALGLAGGLKALFKGKPVKQGRRRGRN